MEDKDMMKRFVSLIACVLLVCFAGAAMAESFAATAAGFGGDVTVTLTIDGTNLVDAKIEGAGHFRLLVSITVPLIKPILSTIAIMKIVDYYNDFTWPLLVISENKKQLVTVILRVFTSVYAASGMGIVYAGYVIASIPLLILFSFASRLYMEGMTAGAVKG